MSIAVLEKYTRNTNAEIPGRATYDAETHHNMSN